MSYADLRRGKAYIYETRGRLMDRWKGVRHCGRKLGAGLVFLGLVLPEVCIAQPARRTDVVLEQLSRLAEGQRQFIEEQRRFAERLTRVEEGQRQLGERLARIEEGQRLLGERITHVEEGQRYLIDRFARVEEGQRQLGERFDNLWTLVITSFGALLAGMFALVGFVLWDRRTALAPAVRQIEELQERERRLEEVLRRYAVKSPDLAEELRKAGML